MVCTCLMHWQDAVALRKIISARKNELELASKSGGHVTPVARIPRACTRCPAPDAAVSGQSLVAEIAALPDDSAEEDVSAVECRDDADSELANVYVHVFTLMIAGVHRFVCRCSL